jgi:hypothetical protein
MIRPMTTPDSRRTHWLNLSAGVASVAVAVTLVALSSGR